MPQPLSVDDIATLPVADVITDPASLEGCSHDEAEWAPYGTPLAVVRPVSAAETQAVVRWCVERRVPIVPRGTVTREHGVGLLKRAGLARELSPAVVELHRAIRRALDPYGILNPGKVIEG